MSLQESVPGIISVGAVDCNSVLSGGYMGISLATSSLKVSSQSPELLPPSTATFLYYLCSLLAAHKHYLLNILQMWVFFTDYFYLPSYL